MDVSVERAAFRNIGFAVLAAASVGVFGWYGLAKTISVEAAGVENGINLMPVFVVDQDGKR